MSYVPISRFPFQYFKLDGNPANGYYLKFYQANSATPISMQTDAGGATSIAKCKLNEYGFPISNPNDNSTVFIPHLSTTYTAYRFVLYASAADADANNVTSGLPNVQSVGTMEADTTLRADLSASSGSSLVGFLQAGTGAVARTVQTTLRDFVNVLQFGATGDGITDDTVAIQLAINEVESRMIINTSTSPYDGSQVLYFPDGYYKVSGVLNITKSITILGSKSSEFSTGARIFQTVSGDLFRFTPAGGGVSFSIERMSLISTVAGAGHLVNIVQGSPGYNSWRILNCCFSNPQQKSIRATGDDFQIVNCTFDVSGWTGEAIQLGSNTAGDKASNGRITGCNFFNIPVRCILSYNAQSVLVANNIVSEPDSSTKTISFFDAQDSAPVLCDGINVTGNILYGIRRAFALAGGRSCAFTSNVGYNCGVGAGEVYNITDITGTNSDISISGNTINGSYDAKSAFRNAGTSTNVSLVGNIFSGSSTGTAMVCAGMTGRVVGNTIGGWASEISATDYYALTYVIPRAQTLPYSASIDLNAILGEYCLIIATNGTAFSINEPTNPSNGQSIIIHVYNNSGGALGVITWNAIFKMTAFVNPAAVNSRLITFTYSSGLAKWTEVSRTGSDIPN